MADQKFSLNISELDLDCIVLKDNNPILVTKEVLVDIIQNGGSYAPVIITLELLERFGFHRSTNNFSKDENFDLGSSIARIRFDGKRFVLNCKYTIKFGSTTVTDVLYCNTLNELQCNLRRFYQMEIKKEFLLEKLNASPIG